MPDNLKVLRVSWRDFALADLCRREPETIPELLAVSGIGEKNAQSFGSEILAELHRFRLNQ